MSDARRRAEEALRYNRTHANSPRVRAALVEALEALLASEPAKVSGSVSIVRSDATPAAPEAPKGQSNCRFCSERYGPCPDCEAKRVDGKRKEACLHYEAADGDCLDNACGVCTEKYRAFVDSQRLPAPSDAAVPAKDEVREAAERLRAHLGITSGQILYRSKSGTLHRPSDELPYGVAVAELCDEDGITFAGSEVIELALLVLAALDARPGGERGE